MPDPERINDLVIPAPIAAFLEEIRSDPMQPIHAHIQEILLRLAHAYHFQWLSHRHALTILDLSSPYQRRTNSTLLAAILGRRPQDLGLVDADPDADPMED